MAISADEKKVLRRSQLRLIDSRDAESARLVMYVGEKPSVYIDGIGYCFRNVPRVVGDGLRELLLLNRRDRFVEIAVPGMYVPAHTTITSFDEIIAPSLPAKPNVLIMRDEGIGDLMMSVPTVRELRRRLSDARIVYATKPRLAEVLRGVSCIDEVVNIHEIDLDAASGWHLVINWCLALEDYSIPRNRGTRIDSFARHIGVGLSAGLADRELEYHIADESRRFAKMLLPEDGKYIGYVLKSAMWNRTYPIWRIPEIAEKIGALFPNKKIVLIDGQIESNGIYGELPNVIDLCGITRTISDAAAVIERCSIIVTPDTGLAHVAAALNVRTLVLMGSLPPETRFADYIGIEVLIAATDIPCCPCWDGQEQWGVEDMRRGRTGGHGIYKSCLHDRVVKCLEAITPDMIIENIKGIIQGGSI